VEKPGFAGPDGRGASVSPSWNVLAVEDQEPVQQLISRALEGRVRVRFAEGVDEALRRLDEERPDLVLLDVALADGDGFQLCSLLRDDDRFRDVPVIFVTGRGATADKVLAFSLGADDYVEKPFDLRELRARVEARLRRREESAASAEIVQRGDLRLDLARFRAFGIEEGRERDLDLTVHEFRLLQHLASREERVQSRCQLVEAVWGDVVVNERTVDSHMSNLRRKLGPLGVYLRAIRGVGYVFDSQATGRG